MKFKEKKKNNPNNNADPRAGNATKPVTKKAAPAKSNRIDYDKLKAKKKQKIAE